MVVWVNVSFDVLTQPWIPVMVPDGTARDVGLLEALEQAHSFCGVRNASPLVEYSIYRFLIVLLMDMLRPEDEEELDELLDKGRLEQEQILHYVDRCRREGVSFDLFDPQKPFLQTSYQKEWDRDPKPVTTLDYSVPSGNNHIHFDHRRERSVYAPGMALRMMLTAQIFCTAGAQGYPSNVNGAPPWFALIQGKNLFETLVFGMIGTERIGMELDSPPALWRGTDEVVSRQSAASTSWLRGMFFPARRIRLIPDGPDGAVSTVYFSQGMNYEVTDSWTDPHVTYRYNAKGRFNWKPSEQEMIWRNLTDLIDIKGKRAPQIVAQYNRLERAEQPMSLVLYGVQTNQANYIKAQRHDLQLPKQMLGNELALRYITGYIESAERLGRALFKALTQDEIPEESRIQARQRYYAVCERLLWSQFDALVRPGFDYNANLAAAVGKQSGAARDCADWALEQLTLRGKTMLRVMEHRQKVLEKEIAALRKGMKT